jgi:hypothetical protein
VPFFDGEWLPFCGKTEMPPLVPPDVLSRSVNELKLDMIDRCLGAQIEAECIIVREIERQVFANDHITAACGKVEIDPHSLTAVPSVLGDLNTPAFRGNGVPAYRILEIIQNKVLSRGHAAMQQCEKDQKSSYFHGSCRLQNPYLFTL